jgi:hypothetical protein
MYGSLSEATVIFAQVILLQNLMGFETIPCDLHNSEQLSLFFNLVCSELCLELQDLVKLNFLMGV